MHPGSFFTDNINSGITDSLKFILLDALAVLFLAVASAIFFTSRKARKNGLKIWDNTARRMVINLLIPLASGGIFCLILIYHNLVFLLAPSTLIFYGLALLNAGKYTFHEIRVLGISEIILGLMASWLHRIRVSFLGYRFWGHAYILRVDDVLPL